MDNPQPSTLNGEGSSTIERRASESSRVAIIAKCEEYRNILRYSQFNYENNY